MRTLDELDDSNRKQECVCDASPASWLETISPEDSLSACDVASNLHGFVDSGDNLINTFFNRLEVLLNFSERKRFQSLG
jgi:hypothetical protein